MFEGHAPVVLCVLLSHALAAMGVHCLLPFVLPAGLACGYTDSEWVKTDKWTVESECEKHFPPWCES